MKKFLATISLLGLVACPAVDKQDEPKPEPAAVEVTAVKPVAEEVAKVEVKEEVKAEVKEEKKAK